MSINKGVLGMNARNFLFIRKFNRAKAKRVADDKQATKHLLIANQIPTTSLIHSFDTRKSIKQFDWSNLPENGFVVKPARGFGGEGILVFTKWKDGVGKTVSSETYTIKQLESHLFDIFEGAFSLQSLPDTAFIEEKITPHPFFKKYAPIGLPDIRIIVCNRVPVMAMLRLPTVESHGKANLHMGALGMGIDLRTGITNHAIYRDKPIEYIPGTKIKTRGIKIPMWDDILLLSVRTQMASRLGYAGVDIVLDAKLGPCILEINARPGLSVQNANFASLRPRLERIEHLSVSNPERGVEVAKSLFAEEFSDKVTIGPKVLSVIEPITILHNGVERTIDAKLDSGAFRTSLDKDLAHQLGLSTLEDKIFIQSASGQQHRPAVKFTFMLAGKKITTTATIASRSHLQFPIIIGRRDLKGFLIDPSKDRNYETSTDPADEN